MKEKPFIIGIAGGTGSGKTTLVDAISDKLSLQSILAIQHDSYYRDRSYLSPLEGEKINYDHPDALETDLLVRHLKDLIVVKKVEIPVYDFATHTRQKKGNTVVPTEVIIVEGLFILADSALRELLDLKIFMDTDDDIRFIRRLQRDTKKRSRSIESIIKQYMETVKRMHIHFVEPSRKYADIILPGRYNSLVIDMIVSLINNKIDCSTLRSHVSK